ncbi:glycosyltransferase [Mangrovibacterium lignilyticum]|uniref:glycosyltransferase n=1 Tax=Mangrovibacterium lignilyticum TaxID=2668052 RepID=UPI0013D1963D|nr:glycosyltransferase family 2 protein [Mangrovibacterium lignilyticum]
MSKKLLKNVAIITPLKDEKDNIPILVEKISKQKHPIKYWVIVENGSTDGSKELLSKFKKIENVENFIVLHFSLPTEKYELGIKYATVVNQGFQYIRKNNIIDELDFIGILDADCFPGPTYYQDLIKFMEKDPQLGIASGLAYSLDGVYDGKSKNWVRGNCRLWKIECFREAGYIIGPSADALSVCKAELKGWKAETLKELSYQCREVGNKVNYAYYGYSAYFRGIPPMYATIKIIKYFAIGQFKNAKGYCDGYFSSYFRKKERINDQDILNYFSKSLRRKLNS